jgi:hypothetical protein
VLERREQIIAETPATSPYHTPFPSSAHITDNLIDTMRYFDELHGPARYVEQSLFETSPQTG